MFIVFGVFWCGFVMYDDSIEWCFIILFYCIIFFIESNSIFYLFCFSVMKSIYLVLLFFDFYNYKFFFSFCIIY